MDLKGSMELAGRNLVANLCPARNYLPYWAIEIDAGYGAWTRFIWPQHNVGRWWDAMLRLESATGFRIPPDREAAMLGNLNSLKSLLSLLPGLSRGDGSIMNGSAGPLAGEGCRSPAGGSRPRSRSETEGSCAAS